MITNLKLLPIGDAAFALDEWETDTLGNVVGNHMRRVVDTRENMCREALITLGWTPPLSTDPTFSMRQHLLERLHKAEAEAAELRARLNDALVAA